MSGVAGVGARHAAGHATTIRGAPGVGAPGTVASGSAPAAGGNAALMPEPTYAGADGLEDAMARVYALMGKKERDDMACGQTLAIAKTKYKQTLAAAQQRAREEQKKSEADEGRGFFGSIAHSVGDFVSNAVHGRFVEQFTDVGKDMADAWNSPAFWHDLEAGAKWVAEIAAVVVAAAASVVTFGAASAALVVIVVIGLSLTAAGMAESQFHYLEAAGVDPKVATWVGVGMSVVGAALTGGAGLAAGGASVASEVGSVAATAGSAAQVVQATAHVKNEQFRAEVVERDCDIKTIRYEIKHAEAMIAEVLAGIEESSKSNRRALETLSSAMQARGQSLVAATATVTKA